MKQANYDTTYCIKECMEKCWRHKSNYEFEKNENYWFTDQCIEEGVDNDRNRRIWED